MSAVPWTFPKLTARREAITPDDWATCAAVAREHGRTFYFASRFLPAHRRRAILAAYAYCRLADDIVDRGDPLDRRATVAALELWERELDEPVSPVARAFAVVREAYAIPKGPVCDLLTGVRMDIAPAPFATWDDLRTYCYHVAGTVGLIVAPILGCRDDSCLPSAVDLGIAMQLTNILRDVAEDAAMGRLYLPLDDLAAFGVDPDAVLSGRPNGRFASLMAFEIERARRHYRDAHRGIAALAPSGQLTTLAASRLYGKILGQIEAQRYDVFRQRAAIPTSRKVQAMPGIAASFVRMNLPMP